MSEKHNELEEHIAEGLKAIDKFARPTRGSGCGKEIGDISNKFFFFECKQKHTHTNIIMDYSEEWLELNYRMPINTPKIPVVAIENKYGDRFVVMSSRDFFRLAKEAKGECQ